MTSIGYLISPEDMQKLENLYFQLEQLVSTVYDQRIEDDLRDRDRSNESLEAKDPFQIF